MYRPEIKIKLLDALILINQNPPTPFIIFFNLELILFGKFCGKYCLLFCQGSQFYDALIKFKNVEQIHLTSSLYCFQIWDFR